MLSKNSSAEFLFHFICLKLPDHTQPKQSGYITADRQAMRPPKRAVTFGNTPPRL